MELNPSSIHPTMKETGEAVDGVVAVNEVDGGWYVYNGAKTLEDTKKTGRKFVPVKVVGSHNSEKSFMNFSNM